jgi:putative SOS response-associated peptidase YedK
MCGRFTMTRRDKTELAAQLGVPESELGDYTPRFNIAPTQPYFVLKPPTRAVKWFRRRGAW